MKAKHYPKSLAIAVLAVVGVLLFASSALAAATARPGEGRGGNSVVCGGVHSKAALIALANGAPDMCGHTDVAAIWAVFGITPAVAKTMHSSTVCGSGGWTSTGRRHSPVPSADKPLAGKLAAFKRPLAVWGKGVCYDAWVGTLEDGTQVAVLKGCGNSEMRKGHRPAAPKPKTPTPTPTTPSVCSVTITGNVSGNVNVCTTYVIVITCNGAPITLQGASVQEVMQQVAETVCSTVTPPATPPVTPPVMQPPTISIVNCTHVQEAPMGQQYGGGSISCTVLSPKGDTIKTVWGAAFGHFTCDTSRTFISTGVDTVALPCFYVAPTEVPSGGFDTISLMATDTSNASVTPVAVPLPAVPIVGADVHPVWMN